MHGGKLHEGVYQIYIGVHVETLCTCTCMCTCMYMHTQVGGCSYSCRRVRKKHIAFTAVHGGKLHEGVYQIYVGVHVETLCTCICMCTCMYMHTQVGGCSYSCRRVKHFAGQP